VVIGLGWAVFSGVFPGVSRSAFEVGLGIIGVVGVGAKVTERRAVKSLDRMVRSLRPRTQES
jgi:hypothetical protein